MVYSLNWLAVAPAQPAIASELRLNITSLGLLGTVFLIGIGSFQLPAGITATRLGARNTALVGLGASSLFAGLSGLAPTFEILVAFRLLTGISMAFFFGPGIAFFTPLFPARERGTALGIYNAGFHAGTLVALGVWPAVVAATGWRMALLLPGVAGVILTLITAYLTRGIGSSKRDVGFGLRGLRNRTVWLAAVVLTLSGGSWYPLTQFGILYLHDDVGIDIQSAGLLMSLVSLTSMLAGPFSGRLFDHFSSKKKLFMYVNLGIAVCLTIFTLHNPVVAAVNLLLLGFFYVSSYNIAYIIPTYSLSQEQLPVAVSIINGTQLVAAASLPSLFAVSVSSLGYGFSWMLLSGLAALSLLFVRLMRFS
jgi:ACS family glucarate transporter-like MFS transporter